MTFIYGAARLGYCWLFVVLTLAAVAPLRAAGEDPERIVERMRSAYARILDYQMLVESSTYAGETIQEETRILYRYRKPGKIRIDFLHPREGWVLVYPSRRGRVGVQAAGMLRSLRLSLAPDDPLLTVWPGQQVTQTDLGLLIEHIAQSLTEKRLGPADISQVEGDLVIRVEAENHFLKGVPTRYEFRIDQERWLPVEVREEIPQLGRKRRVRFRELRTDLGFPDTLFQLR